MTMTINNSKIKDLLGNDANELLGYQAKGFNKSLLHLPGPDFVDRVVAGTAHGQEVHRRRIAGCDSHSGQDVDRSGIGCGRERHGLRCGSR